MHNSIFECVATCHHRRSRVHRARGDMHFEFFVRGDSDTIQRDVLFVCSCIKSGSLKKERKRGLLDFATGNRRVLQKIVGTVFANLPSSLFLYFAAHGIIGVAWEIYAAAVRPVIRCPSDRASSEWQTTKNLIPSILLRWELRLESLPVGWAGSRSPESVLSGLIQKISSEGSSVSLPLDHTSSSL